MVDTAPYPPNLATDTWVAARWEEYAALMQQADYDNARSYYNQGWMRLEMAPLGPWHGRDNAIVSKVISLYAALQGVRVVELVNTTFRKAGTQDAQPDLAFYLGQNFRLPPRDNQPVDVALYGAPQLAVEVAATTLADDLGRKRLLYERLGGQEYWVVDVNAGQVYGFAIANGGSVEIRQSLVLPGLSLETVEAAMARSQTEDDGAITRWLLNLFQPES